MSEDHELILRTDPGFGLTWTWLCNAPEGAMCRVTCEEGCESWNEDHDGIYAVGNSEDLTPHKLTPVDTCNFVESMDEQGSAAGANSEREQVLYHGPVSTVYDEGYQWSIPGGNADV